MRSRAQERVVVASLVHPTVAGPSLLPVLDHMRLTRVSGERFVLFGFEEVQETPKRVETYPQAWLCTLVAPAGGGVHAVDEDEDELEGLALA